MIRIKAISHIVTTVALLFVSSPVLAQSIDEGEFAKAIEHYLKSEKNVAVMGEAIEQHLKKKYEKKAKQNEKKVQLEETQKLEDQFKNPVNIQVGNSPIRGNKDAPITIIEFSEFQCPYCRRGSQTVHDIMKEYPGKVKWAFKHLPLPFHSQAKPAARASLAAREQGKFWEMHDKMFENQKSLNEETFIKHAEEIGLDVEKFKADFNSTKFDKEIEEDLALATEHGVRGTPGYFVNGVQVKGARALPYFKKIIDRWLETEAKGEDVNAQKPKTTE